MKEANKDINLFMPQRVNWLNMVEIELNALVRQCLNRRIESLEKIIKEGKSWEEYRNIKNLNIFEWVYVNFIYLCCEFTHA
jgi:hypothetical protein